MTDELTFPLYSLMLENRIIFVQFFQNCALITSHPTVVLPNPFAPYVGTALCSWAFLIGIISWTPTRLYKLSKRIPWRKNIFKWMLSMVVNDIQHENLSSVTEKGLQTGHPRNVTVFLKK